MPLNDTAVPACPSCEADAMYHRCITPDPSQATFVRNGWYCEACGSGPYQLGSVSEKESASLAARLLSPDASVLH